MKTYANVELGDPWDFSSYYIYNSYRIEFLDVINFAKEGPLCGNLQINGCEINHEGYSGFGGPVLFCENYMYLTLHERNKSFFDTCGSYLIELNLSSKTIRIIGSKKSVIYIDHIEDGLIYYNSECPKNPGRMKSIEIKSGKEKHKLLGFEWCIM